MDKWEESDISVKCYRLWVREGSIKKNIFQKESLKKKFWWPNDFLPYFKPLKNGLIQIGYFGTQWKV